jgi:AcrR family transcriptional regulator
MMAIGRPRGFDIEQALDRATQVFWRQGYAGASLTDLTQAMGINPPSLYAAFGNKEGLFRAVLDRYGAGRAAFLETVLAAPTARAVAERLLYGTADTLGDPAHPPGCLFTQAGLACGGQAAAVPGELAARRACLEDALRTRFGQAQAAGDLPAHADPQALACYLSTVGQGMAVQAAAGADRATLRRVAELALSGFPA